MTSQLVSFPSDVSFVEEEDAELAATEFYHLVLQEQRDIATKYQTKVFRWSIIVEQLSRKHPYFGGKSKEKIRSRFKYIKKKMKSIK